MTQTFSPVDLPKHLEEDRGSGRFDYLYGNGKNATQTRQLSPDELLSKGYRDGLKSVMTSSMGDDPNYLKGWDMGYKIRNGVADS